MISSSPPLILFFLILVIRFHYINAANLKLNDKYLLNLHFSSSWNGDELTIINKPLYYIKFNDSATKKILFVGDSLDRNAALSLCELNAEAKQTAVTFKNINKTCTHYTSGKQLRQESFHCAYANYHVEALFLGGVMMDEDCFWQRLNESQSYRDSIAFVPDLIVFKSFYWDISYIAKHVNSQNWTIHESYIDIFYHRMSAFVSTLQAVFPTTQFALKTDPLWKQDHNRFGNPKLIHTIGLRLYNKVRLIAAEKKLPLFDYFRVFEELAPEVYLQDDIHIKPHYSYIVLNTLYGYLS